MRLLLLVALPLILLGAASSARAEDPPDPATAFFAGAATSVVGIFAGSLVMGAGERSDSADNIGWLTMCGAFTLTPVVAHGVEGEWLRGLAFASLPAAMTAGTSTLFAFDPGTVDHGSLWEQRLMWSLYGVAFAGAALGVVDAMLAPRRARAHDGTEGLVVAPLVGAGRAGLQIVGTL